MFHQLPVQPPDPLFGINDAFLRDTNPNKLNLGVGAYRDENLKPFVLPVVTKIEEKLLKERVYNKEYLPITGLKEFCEETRKVILGTSSPSIAAGRVATVQTLSGTGALALALTFIKRFTPTTTIYLSNPTWANHNNLCTGASLTASWYRYYDATTRGLDFPGMMEDITEAPDKSVFLLHVCAHNPTGVDLTKDQWAEVLSVFKAKKHYALFDCAYQGFATGDLDQDAYAVRLFDAAGMEFTVCQSYAKNFGLYGERVGAVNIVVNSADTADRVLGQVSRIIRQMYSNPPRHGAEIVATCLRDPALYQEWVASLKVMSGRIILMRQLLHRELTALKTPGSWRHIVDQIGMFAYTGLSPKQVQRLTQEHHVYLTSDGRISMAGLNERGCRYLANAINEVVLQDEAKL